MQKLIGIALTALLCAASRFVAAGEILNVAVPHRGARDSSYAELGLQQDSRLVDPAGSDMSAAALLSPATAT